MNLIIVESPTKAKTITKFLSKDNKVESSFGHVRDLKKSQLSIDVENNFEPTYEVPAKATRAVEKLKSLARKADMIILASDEDREGEAIAWHLFEALNLKKEKTKRIVFHEITKPAILKAMNNPRGIDMKLVDAQQARRILDRLVGYELSPFLWKKVARGLSAGRVQSVAMRLIVEREREIKAFNAQEYWSIETELKKNNEDEKFNARLNKINNKAIGKFEIKNEKEAKEIIEDLKNRKYKVLSISKKENKKNPPRPFTTSTLQQTANRFLGFSAKQTMMVAQKLYEKGYITYMRTDSLNLSNKFLKDAKDYLDKNIGKEYSLKTPRIIKTKSKGAQEAHEAIRPTEANNNPDKISSKLDNNQNRLYKLIWQRSMASQMQEAIVDSTTVDVEAIGEKEKKTYCFRASGQIIKFDGYLKIYPEKSKEIILPNLKEKEELDLIKLIDEQHFTKPPARYSDAGLVKNLEKHGIGRPSTYAPTIATIIARNYVKRDENKRLFPTEIAFIVNDLLVKHFNNIVDFEFTAKLENELDEIAEGKKEWQPVINNFYKPFHSNLENKYDEVNKKEIMPEEKSNEICEKCKSKMIIKTGRFGKFLACSSYPDCKNIKPMPGTDKDKDGKADSEEIKELQEKYKGEKCEKCDSDMAIKVGRFGPFLACTAYPKCKNIKNIKENNNSTGIKCPKCGKGEIVQKRSKRGIFYACDAYPDCRNAYWSKPTGEKCPDCESLLVEVKDGAKCSNKECGYSK
jgi:DNA topoisomerase-1